MDQKAQTSNRQTLRQLLASLPAILAGDGSAGQAQRIREAVLKAGAVEMLAIIKDAYMAKARGGTDEAGIRWAELKPETIAYHRRHPGLNARRGKAAKKGREMRPLLTDAQDRVWRAVYASSLGRTRDRAQSAASAWAVVKAMGGKTILKEYGSQPVEIGRDTGRLLASLSPGQQDCLLSVLGSRVTVGSNVEYAGHFHRRRPLWPEVLPDAWQERVAQVMADALMLALAAEMR